MGRRVLLKQAAQLTGLSEWELSSGARAGEISCFTNWLRSWKICF